MKRAGLRVSALVLVSTVILSLMAAPAHAISSLRLEQCANGADGTLSPCIWGVPALGPAPTRYSEGDVVPFRLPIWQIEPGVPLVVAIRYAFEQGGAHGYDILTSPDVTEVIDPGGERIIQPFPEPGGVPIGDVPDDTAPFPDDPLFDGDGIAYDPEGDLAAGERLLWLFGGTIDAIAPPVHDGGSATVLATITPTFQSAVLLWGGHLARGAGGWGAGEGAGSVPDPFSMAVPEVDGEPTFREPRFIDPSLAIVASPNLGITKAADDPTIGAGDVAGYTITVTNDGGGAATDVTLTDALPAGPAWSVDDDGGAACAIDGGGTLTCTRATLDPGDSVAVHVAGTTGPEDCEGLVNTARVAASNNEEISSDAAPIAVRCPSLRIAKDPVATPVDAGDPAGFTITVTNDGPGAATDVVLTDDLPGGLDWAIESSEGADCAIDAGVLTCTRANLGSGESLTVTVTALAPAAVCGTDLANTGTVVANEDGPLSDDATVRVLCAAITVEKIPDAPAVDAGDPLGYTLRVTSTGAAAAKDVRLTDLLPGALVWDLQSTAGDPLCTLVGTTLECTKSRIPTGESFEVHVTAPTSPALCGDPVENSASVTTSNNGNDDVGPVPIDVLCPDIAVTKVADDPSIPSGGTAGYLITVTNDGPGAANGVDLTDVLPAGLGWGIESATGSPDCGIVGGTLGCTWETIPPETSFTVHVTSPTPGLCGRILNESASVAVGNGDPAATADPVAIAVLCPDIALTKVAGATPIDAGTRAAYTLTVRNDGDGAARDVVLTDALPAAPGLAWGVADDGGADCAIAAGVLTCTLPELGTGDSLVVLVDSPTTPRSCRTISNSAGVTISNGDPDATGFVPITILCPVIAVAKLADASTVNAGTGIGYTIVVTNVGAGTATNVRMTDGPPALPGLAWTIDLITGGARCNTNPRGFLCSAAALAPGASFTVHIVSPTTAASCGVATNTATASAQNALLAASTPTVPITIVCPGLVTPGAAGLVLAKTADAATVDAGGPIGFTITLSNPSTVTAEGVSLGDSLPAATGLVWSLDGGSGCSLAGTAVACAPGTLPPGASVSAHVSSPTTDASCGTVSNTASYVSTNGGTGSAQASVEVLCEEEEPASFDLNVGVPAFLGFGTFTLTFEISGSGGAIGGLVFTDTLCDTPAVLAGGDADGDGVLDPGEVWTFDCTITIGPDDPDPLIGIASVDGVQISVQAARVRPQAVGDVIHAEVQHATDVVHPAIAVDVTPDPTSGKPDETVTYTFAVSNTSTDTPLTGVSVDDDVLGHIGDAGALGPGETRTFTADLVLGNLPVTDVVTASGIAPDGSTVSAQDTATVSVVLGVIFTREPPKGKGSPDGTEVEGVSLARTGAGVPGAGFGFALIGLGTAMSAVARRRERPRKLRGHRRPVGRPPPHGPPRARAAPPRRRERLPRRHDPPDG